MKWLKRILFVLSAVFIGIQFVRPARTNPSIDPAKELHAPPHVAAILDRSCMDCHSNRTRWPWYTSVAPVSWWIIDHVNEGRHELSFSAFGGYTQRRQTKKMEQICEEVEEGEMPLREYLWLHPSARLSEADRQTLCAWSKAEQRRLRDVKK